nr:RNA-directed DNA polymerase, eukaryota, reverse transcriptase zinc-binding domain protein [Tanacetum cinerariifolium]
MITSHALQWCKLMRFMGFNDTWINWISGCLNNATSLILINGSPTREFNIQCGLRQGDPLSPFLFIIAMEGLHVAIEDTIAAGLYRGLKVRNISLSHLFFTDDALFIGDWSTENISSLVSILECFHKVSGLKIKFHKSNLFGIGVNFDDVRRAATITGCNAMSTPFIYLGLPIDCNMASVKNWDPIVDKFNKCLSKWKASMLSIGGRATFVSSVLGSLGTYYLSLFPMPITVCKKLESIRDRFFWGSDGSTKKLHWIAWNSVTASKRNGGLGIGSLFSLNHALIQKLRWRFVNHPQSLWVRLNTAIHGGVENVTTFFRNISSQSVWGRIVGSINTMHEKGFISLSTLSRRVNNGADTKFWLESWMHNSPLYQQYPRLFRLVVNNDCFVKDCWNNGWQVPWSRPILSGTNASHVAELYNKLAYFSLNDYKDVWSWSLGAVSFSVKSTREHTDLSFLPSGDSSSKSDKHSRPFLMVDALHLSASKKSIVDSICGVVLWSLWSFRNESIFGSSMPKRSIIADKTIDLSFRWYTSRNKLSSISWNNWIQNPLAGFSL